MNPCLPHNIYIHVHVSPPQMGPFKKAFHLLFHFRHKHKPLFPRPFLFNQLISANCDPVAFTTGQRFSRSRLATNGLIGRAVRTRLPDEADSKENTIYRHERFREQTRHMSHIPHGADDQQSSKQRGLRDRLGADATKSNALLLAQ